MNCLQAIPARDHRAAVNVDFEQYVDKYYKFWQRLITKDETAALFKPTWPKVKHVMTLTSSAMSLINMSTDCRVRQTILTIP